MDLLQSFVIAFSMYSGIPMPRMEWKEKNMKYAMCFFPLIGAVIGAALYLVGGLLLRSGCGKLLFASVMTLIPLLISGGIHMDGFMDTMDALRSFGDREKKLAILKDSHNGAFAVLGLGCYLVWSLGVWSEIQPDMLCVIGFTFVISRGLSAYAVVALPPARKEGLVKTFRDSARIRAVKISSCIYIMIAGVWMLRLSLLYGTGALAGAAVVFLYYDLWVCKKQFGGVTGDLAGYFLQLCELAMLTGVLAAGWIGRGL